MGRWIFVLLLLAVAGSWGGCGTRRAPGGTGRLERSVAQPYLLVLAGSPHEMGWWHGHLLRDEILGRVAAARRLEPAEYLDLFVDQAMMHLSERLRQELEGMAAASGAEPEGILRVEVARDVLRFRGGADLMEGMAGLAPVEDGFEVRMRYAGPGAPPLARDLLIIQRTPAVGPESLVLARPGSLGGWAAVTDAGRGYVLAEVEIRNGLRRGFGGGRPFVVMAREALSASSDVESQTARMTGTMGHTGIGFSAHPRELPRVRALAGVQVYGAPEPPWDLGTRAFLAIGPFDDPESEEARALQAQIVAPRDLSLASRWLQLESLADPAPSTGAPRVQITWRGGRAGMRWDPGGGRRPRAVTLD